MLIFALANPMSPEEVKILIIDEVHQVLLDKLQSYDVQYTPKATMEELRTLLPDAGVLVMRSKIRMEGEWMDSAKDLKIIARMGSGMDNIDMDEANRRGIICLNAPEGNRDSVAEQTLGMILALLNNFHKSQLELEQEVWDRKTNSGLELGNLTLGIVGYGNTGSCVASKAKGFGCRLLAYDLYRKDFGDDYVEEVDLNTIMKEADIISLHVPLNPQSDHMVNDEFISRLAKPVYLINVSRGDVMDTAALIRGLKDGKIRGAGLDVLENEKPSTFTDTQREQFRFLLSHPHVLLTPHIAGLTSDSFYRLSSVIGDKLVENINISLL